MIRLLKFLSSLLFTNQANKINAVIAAGGSIAAVAGIIAWIFGPGREWTICLNALELSGVVFGGSLLIEWARRTPPD